MRQSLIAACCSQSRASRPLHAFLAVLGVFVVAGVASAQPQPVRPLAAAPVLPAYGAGSGPAIHGSFTMSGGGCQTGYACNSGCGSLRSDLGFHFGSCKSFFAPCGPGLHGGHGGLFGKGYCPTLPFAEPWGKGWTCPPCYDSYANH
jgi:hypothetical protein